MKRDETETQLERGPAQRFATALRTPPITATNYAAAALAAAANPHPPSA